MHLGESIEKLSCGLQDHFSTYNEAGSDFSKKMDTVFAELQDLRSQQTSALIVLEKTLQSALKDVSVTSSTIISTHAIILMNLFHFMITFMLPGAAAGTLQGGSRNSIKPAAVVSHDREHIESISQEIEKRFNSP